MSERGAADLESGFFLENRFAGRAFAELMAIRAGSPLPSGEVTITGSDPFFRTPYRMGETLAAALVARGVAANDLWELRTGRRQQVKVDVRAAAATSLLEEISPTGEMKEADTSRSRSPSTCNG